MDLDTRPTQEQATQEQEFEFDFAMCHGSYGYRGYR